tara:strand:- start:4140 stop:4610 length:471 start_codon:yes stop_codon:yes gene_type:complete
MSTELALGNYLTFSSKVGVTYRFQNFHIAQTSTFQGQSYQFLPFGFSGITVSRTGDNTDASLIFPNNQLSRAWATTALQDRWMATVFVLSLDPDDRTTGTLMHQYTGQAASGTWDESSLKMTLNTVIDAVGADVPMRRLTQTLVGALPVSGNVRLQ